MHFDYMEPRDIEKAKARRGPPDATYFSR